MAKQLLGKEVTAALNERIKADVAALKEKGINPTLGIIRVGENESDISYERGATKRCETLGVDEKGIDVATGRVLVEVSPEFFRPAEVDLLLGDPTKARETLGWNPRKTSFDELVKIMTEHDMELVKRSATAGVLK